MVKRVIITFDDDVIERLDKQANEFGISRNLFVAQICRKFLNMPSVFEETEP